MITDIHIKTCTQCGATVEEATETPRVFPVDFSKEPDARYIMSDIETLEGKPYRRDRSRVPVVIIREHGV